MESRQADVYEIRVGTALDVTWSEWFDGVDIRLEGENPPVTLLTCTVVDQPALHGILAKVRDLNLTLLEVKRV